MPENSKNIDDLSEIKLQHIVHNMLSDPAIVRNTESGKRIQVLSPGRINHSAGPDFIEIAILLNGSIVVGDAEFHRNANEWEEHGHTGDNNYNRVILHIVLNDNANVNHNFEILQIDPAEVIAASKEKIFLEEKENIADIFEDLQHFALARILRKTGDAKKVLQVKSLIDTLVYLTQQFLQRYYSRRKRPVYNAENLIDLANSIHKSTAAKFLLELNDLTPLIIQDRMMELIKKPIGEEGTHLRREIVLNCVLPLALAISNEESRINLFLWFWSIPALCSYGKLKRRFEKLPQNYLWQQQGMLEYLREYGSKTELGKDKVMDYDYHEVLSFYYNGTNPFNKY